VSGSQLYYGGVLLDGVTVESWEQVTRYDESNTDKLYDEFTIAVSTVLYANSLGKTIGATNVSGSSAATIQLALQTVLSTPRLAFRFVSEGTTLLETSGADLDNGPKPLMQSVTPVGQTFHIRFSLRVCVLRCGVGTIDNVTGIPGLAALAVPAVLIHRWNYEEQIDQHYNRRRIWKGTLRTRQIDIPPHLLRNVVTPPLAKGFKRQHVHFNQSRDGLSCDYQVVDVAIDRAPPYPAIDWGFSHRCSTGTDGLLMHVDFSTWMVGANGCDAIQLVSRCIEAALSRVGVVTKEGLQGFGGTVALIEHVVLGESGGSSQNPRAELLMRVMVTKDPAKPQTMGIYATFLGQEFTKFSGEYRRNVATPLPSYDPSVPTAAFFTYLQSPCGGFKTHPQSPGNQRVQGEKTQTDPQSPLGDDQKREQPSAQFQVKEETLKEPQPTAQSQVQAKTSTAYTQYDISSVYKTINGKIVVPVQPQVGQDEGGTTIDSPIVILRKHEPYTIRTVEVHAERMGEPPQMPKPEDVAETSESGGAETLLEHTIAPEAPQLGPDGRTYIVRLHGRYVFALHKSIRNGDTEARIRFGIPPFLDGSKLSKKWFKLPDLVSETIFKDQ
jgi:hypothetical protein